MNEIEAIENETGSIRKLPLAASFVALVGVADSVYLTVKHFTAEPVPCSLISGCETVLTSSYAEVMEGVPLAAMGAVAYFIAFSLAILAAYGNRVLWTVFGIQVVLMSLFTVWLLYLQAYVIGAFCQFCLVSAATTFTMLLIFLASRLTRFR
ncbi:MAG TPA: vitamin K epoxide reductase family protein [Pyrinomonadaceae bacterium]